MLENKIALVTGASRGIGKAIATSLGKQQATVIGTATTDEGAEKISASFAEQGIQGQGKKLNVTEPEAIDAVIAEITSNYAAPTILVNNAAITRDNLILRMKQDEWDAVIDTNLTAIYRTTKICLKGMLKAKWGRIINIASVVACMGNPGQANYAAAKAGMIGYSKALAQEVMTRGITVNVIAPGLIETDMSKQLNEAQHDELLSKIPMGRLGSPEEIAHCVAFLAHPLAGYVTGHTLHANGGMYFA